jgi:hypothetical protein
MNNRILELAEQAGIAVWGDAVYMYHPSDTLDSTVLAKFTELIVEECAEQVKNLRVNDYGISGAEIIREHFGVEV